MEALYAGVCSGDSAVFTDGETDEINISGHEWNIFAITCSEACGWEIGGDNDDDPEAACEKFLDAMKEKKK